MATQGGPYGFLGDQLSTLDKAQLLRSVPLLSDISENYLRASARHSRDLRLDSGAVLVREGDAGNELLLLLEGIATVEHQGKALNTLKAGDHVGELSLLDGQPRSADVIASSPVRVLTIDHAAFDQVVANEPSLAPKIIASLCRMIRGKTPIPD